MTPGGRRMRYSRQFLGEIHAFEEYLRQTNPSKAKRFVSQVFDFAINVIESNPFAFPEHPRFQTPAQEFRRAVFQKKYILVYQVTKEHLDFLSIYHTSRNPDSIELDGDA